MTIYDKDTEWHDRLHANRPSPFDRLRAEVVYYEEPLPQDRKPPSQRAGVTVLLPLLVDWRRRLNLLQIEQAVSTETPPTHSGAAGNSCSERDRGSFRGSGRSVTVTRGRGVGLLLTSDDTTKLLDQLDQLARSAVRGWPTRLRPEHEELYQRALLHAMNALPKYVYHHASGASVVTYAMRCAQLKLTDDLRELYADANRLVRLPEEENAQPASDGVLDEWIDVRRAVMEHEHRDLILLGRVLGESLNERDRQRVSRATRRIAADLDL